MSTFLKKGRRKSKKQNLGIEYTNYPGVKTRTFTREEVKNIKPNPLFEKRKKNEENQMMESKFIDKRPIECLELNGYEVLRDSTDTDNVLVFVDNSYDFTEGIISSRKERVIDKGGIFPFIIKINEKLIEDYSSLWEITMTGWYSHFYEEFKGDTFYPYLYVRKKGSDEDYRLWRWDNSTFLRVKCLTHNWTKENFEIFQNGVLLKNHKLLYDRLNKRRNYLNELYS